MSRGVDVRSGLAFRRDPLGFLQSRQNGGGPIRFRAGLTDFTVLVEPDTIHHILVSDADSFGEGKWTLRGRRVMGDCLITREGPPHRARRALVRPAFERRRLAARAPAMVARAQRLADSWREGQTLDVRGEMSRLALATSAEALFDLELEPQAPTLVGALDVLLEELPRPGLPWPAGRRLASARRVMRRAVGRAIAERRARPVAGEDDLLTTLLDTLDEPAAVDEVVALLIAAVDTVPRTLTRTWELVGRHPEVEARLHAELDEALDGGRPPTVDDLARLPYLDQVVGEVLRLHPSVHFIDRRPLADVELEGRRVGADDFLLLSPLLTQRDPRFYPEPAEFRPERFAPDQRAGRPRFAYFPFGAGPHACIGMSLARLELGLIVATLGSRWRLAGDSKAMTVAAR